MNYAQLTGAQLSEADLTGADLRGALLNEANLNFAQLIKANLSGTPLIKATLNFADLTGADLRGALLNEADLTGAQLTSATLSFADLTGADLTGAQLSEADLGWANLNGANLSRIQLKAANLWWAQLNRADLTGANVEKAHFSYTFMTDAIYAPASPPPDPYVAGIKGLRTVTFPEGEEIGLVQLRELIQKAGLRDLEREATYAIEHGRSWHALAGWKQNLAHAAEGAFRFVFFEAPAAYGLHPGRPLLIIVALWVGLIPVYLWPLYRKRNKVNGNNQPRWPEKVSGIYRIWPKDRIEISHGEPIGENPIIVERLQGGGWDALSWASYFSLLSAFHIGFREFNVGTWLARLQAREYVLKPIGWVRVVSGIQSLLSVYLLAISVITYFGRLFQ